MAGDLTAGGEHLAHFIRSLPIGGKKWPPPLELAQQEVLTSTLVPVAVVPAFAVGEAEPPRDRIEHVSVAL